MFKKMKLKIAARRVQRTQPAERRASRGKIAANATPRTKTQSRRTRTSAWARLWNVLGMPVRWIWRQVCRLWRWIRGIDLIGLVNLTLLVAIIVLFSLLIIDVIQAHRTPTTVIVAEPVPVIADTNPQVSVSDANAPRGVRPRRATPSLPIKRDVQTREYTQHPITVTPARPCPVTVRQTARVANTIYGDTVIDGRSDAHILRDNTTVQGNLYLQNMRKYTLPCGMTIRGNLFLRDVNMLQFCGAFTVTGNIYVSPRSSFGPLPRTARLGGQVIL